MNRSCFLSLAACRTPLNPWDTRSPLCVGLVLDWTMFSLVRALPSPTSAEDCSSLFGWFIGTTAQSDPSGACMSALRLWAFANRPRSWLDRDVPEVSRFSCMLFLSVPGFLDYAGPPGHSRFSATSRDAFLLGNRVQRPNQDFSKLNRPAHRYPCLRFNQHLAMLAARLGAKMDSLLLSCRTLSFPTTCRFIPAHYLQSHFPFPLAYQSSVPNGAYHGFVRQ